MENKMNVNKLEYTKNLTSGKPELLKGLEIFIELFYFT